MASRQNTADAVASSPKARSAKMQEGRPAEENEETHDEPHAEPEEPEEPEVEDATAPHDYIEPSDDQLLPPPNFNPFFSLIEDESSGEYHHPSVHYIFADDDHDVLVAAAMRSLGTEPPPYPPSDTEADSKGKARVRSRVPALPRPRPGVKERYVLVDVGPDGQTIDEVQSLSPDWAVTATSITNAPTFEEEESSLGQGTALMLRIQGTGLGESTVEAGTRDPTETIWDEAKSRCNGDMMASMSDIVERMKKSMSVLDKVTSSTQSQSQPDGE
ncbi:hypothetical protein P152DRAFT_453687 [Eremomyces bilateralis CBS 781.70]|uniref:Uncharacterized protein n=1 Tax=Eremomyces bilateralis CBS 781.70 TaxID=1392243 RepID=A0A6G1GGQ0_9PEZI|nr:uncharacterized protein P152DRAFT_453687 [Eremomyces bilateralis CBS 781.70]KAF1817081.1 hypothetical protein P152DRAFT_453687 [Eremomyces bilateralis CBS 781.70]